MLGARLGKSGSDALERGMIGSDASEGSDKHPQHIIQCGLHQLQSHSSAIAHCSHSFHQVCIDSPQATMCLLPFLMPTYQRHSILNPSTQLRTYLTHCLLVCMMVSSAKRHKTFLCLALSVRWLPISLRVFHTGNTVNRDSPPRHRRLNLVPP